MFNEHVRMFLSVINVHAHAQTVSSEVLRQYGLFLLRSHIVLLTRTRACPLEPLAQSPPVPRWKLFRMPKGTVIMDEPQGAHEKILLEKLSGMKCSGGGRWRWMEVDEGRISNKWKSKILD